MDFIDTTTDGIGELIHFYDTLPNYDDINHLTNSEFDEKLQNWKTKQKWFSDYLQHQLELENKDTQWTEKYKRLFTHKKNPKKEIESINSPVDNPYVSIYELPFSKKNLIRKEKRKAKLQSGIKPFSFTRRDEENQELSKLLSKSLPCIYHEETISSEENHKQFKAKPIPKNLFSNYAYKKMEEDEFYRFLQKRIRSEEMLRSASLPPSMAKREKRKFHFDVCPRFYKDYESTNGSKRKNIFNFKKNRLGSTSATNSCSELKSSSLIGPFNRTNLAAVLRVESAKNRLEMEEIKRIEEAKLRRHIKLKEKLLRKKPIWNTTLSSYGSHKEDLAARLQMRRDEEHLREKEHRNCMEEMLGRVNKQPTLLERQSRIYNNNNNKIILNDDDLIYNFDEMKLK